MKVTFPHMGNIVIFKKLVEIFGHEAVVPPRPSKRTFDLGVKYSPEFACFPYKVLLGSYIEALEMGADTILTSGGSGPCRAGFYAEVHEKTLRSLGFNFNIFVFDDYQRDPHRFRENLRNFKGKYSWPQVLAKVLTVYRLARALDSLQKQVEISRAYEVEKGSFSRVYESISRRFDQETKQAGDLRRLYLESKELLQAVPCHKRQEERRLRIGVVGEIYVVMESAVNMNIVEVLNSLGCEVTRSMYISEWVDHAVLPKCFKNRSGAKLVKDSLPYIEIGIGGHEQHNIGNIIKYKNEGYDGIIHLMPFACLPELVTQSVAPRISQDWGIPILTLALDEQTGIANNLTRIEAFVELLRSIKISNIA